MTILETIPIIEQTGKYIVQLDDNYSVNEFYNKYKVLEHTKYTDVYTVDEIDD